MCSGYRINSDCYKIIGFTVFYCKFAPQTALSSPIYRRRKVRTPKSSILGNAQPLKGEDKCNRKYVQIML
jgi:hypothetical protein